MLWTTFVLLQGLRTAMLIYGGAELFCEVISQQRYSMRLTSPNLGSLKYSPISNVCIPTNTKYRSAALMIVPGIYDVILLGLTLVKGIRSLRVNSGSAIVCLKFQLSPIWKTDVKDPRCPHWFGTKLMCVKQHVKCVVFLHNCVTASFLPL